MVPVVPEILQSLKKSLIGSYLWLSIRTKCGRRRSRDIWSHCRFCTFGTEKKNSQFDSSLGTSPPRDQLLSNLEMVLYAQSSSLPISPIILLNLVWWTQDSHLLRAFPSSVLRNPWPWAPPRSMAGELSRRPCRKMVSAPNRTRRLTLS